MVEEFIKIILGRTKAGNELSLKLTEGFRLGIIGRSGSGKTNFLENLILSTAKAFNEVGRGEQVQFIGIDMKGGKSLAPIAARFSGDIVDEPARVEELVNSFNVLMEHRMKKTGNSKIDLIDPEFPLIILVVEELTSLMTSQDLSPAQKKKLKSLFTNILVKCRASNMGVIFASQSFAAENALDTAARDQLQQLVLMRSSESSIKLLEPSAADIAPAWLLNTSGEFYWNDGKQTNYIHAKTWYTSDEKAREVANRYSYDVRQDLGLLWSPENPL